MRCNLSKCIVTGGAGFIGSHLCELLLDQGHSVVALDNLVNGNIENLSNLKNHPKFSFHQVDIRSQAELEPFFQNIDWVFHLAALADIVPSIESPEAYYSTNVTGTFNVIEAAKKANAKKLVYAASSSCYGLVDSFPTKETDSISPQYPYALTKYMGEELVMHWSHVYKLPSISLRLFNVYGPRSRTNGTYGAVFGVFLAQKLHNKPFTIVGDGTQTRDFTFVTDVARAFYAAACSNQKNTIYNVGSGNHYSVNYLVELLKGEKVHIPKRPGEPECTFADIQKIKDELDWMPKVSFEEGVQEILKNKEYWINAPVWDPDSIQNATKTWFKCLKEEDEFSIKS